jgi:hypothetical protein
MLSRNLVAVGCFLVMESLIFYAVAHMLAGGAGGSGPAYITVLLATLAGFGLTRGLQRLDLSVPVLVAAGAGSTVLVLTVLLNLQYNTGGNPLSFSWLFGFAESPDQYLQTRWPQTWGVVIVCAAWIRSVWTAQRDFTYGLVLTSFSIGLFVFVLTLIFGQSSRAGERISFAALPFFMSGLLTLALVRIQAVEESEGSAARGPWLQIVVGTVAALGVVSAILGLFPLGLLNRLLAPVGILLLRILDIVILAIALPISWIAIFILSMITGRDVERPQLSQLASEGAERVQQEGTQSPLLGFLLVIFKFLFVLLVLAIVAYVLYLIFRRLRRPATRSGDELRESIEGEGGLGDDLNALWRGLLDRLRRPAGPEREPPLSANARKVRRLYLDLLADAEMKGSPRPPPATPGEFAPELDRTYHATTPTRLSDRFAAVRYGREEPAGEEVESIEREINDLRRP